jgi:hypothetical protein
MRSALANGSEIGQALVSQNDQPRGSTACRRCVYDLGQTPTRVLMQNDASRTAAGDDGTGAKSATQPLTLEGKEKRRWSSDSSWRWTIAREQAGGVLDPWWCRVFSSKDPTCPMGARAWPPLAQQIRSRDKQPDRKRQGCQTSKRWIRESDGNADDGPRIPGTHTRARTRA